MTIEELDKGVRRYFNQEPDRWLWPGGLFYFGKVMIDIAYVYGFIGQHEDYNDDETLLENITRIYGKEAADFVERGIHV